MSMGCWLAARSLEERGSQGRFEGREAAVRLEWPLCAVFGALGVHKYRP